MPPSSRLQFLIWPTSGWAWHELTASGLLIPGCPASPLRGEYRPTLLHSAQEDAGIVALFMYDVVPVFETGWVHFMSSHFTQTEITAKNNRAISSLSPEVARTLWSRFVQKYCSSYWGQLKISFLLFVPITIAMSCYIFKAIVPRIRTLVAICVANYLVCYQDFWGKKKACQACNLQKFQIF